SLEFKVVTLDALLIIRRQALISELSCAPSEVTLQIAVFNKILVGDLSGNWKMRRCCAVKDADSDRLGICFRRLCAGKFANRKPAKLHDRKTVERGCQAASVGANVNVARYG